MQDLFFCEYDEEPRGMMELHVSTAFLGEICILFCLILGDHRWGNNEKQQPSNYFRGNLFLIDYLMILCILLKWQHCCVGEE